MPISRLAFVLCLTLFASGAAVAADVRNGEALAKRWCSTCHVVARDQTTTTGEAPPFTTIAKMPDLDAAKLVLFLLSPHPKMPDMGLSRGAAEDLAAYISSQK